MDNRLQRCLEEGKLSKIGVQPDLVKKEIDAASFDLESAEKSMKENNPKWSIVQAYYSMFHTAKGLVLAKGYREKSHACLAAALKALFVDENALELKQFQHFRDCMNLREEADYGLIYSDKSAEEVIGWAKEFLEAAKKILKQKTMPPKN